MVPNVVGSREEWELCIVTDGIIVGMLVGEGAHIATLLYVTDVSINKNALNVSLLSRYLKYMY
jgi:hypothetical protein